MKVNWGSKVVAQAQAQVVGSRLAKLVRFMLTPAGQRDLLHSSSHQLRVLITIHDSSGATASKHMTLYPYSVSGPGPARASTASPTVRVADTNAYVSSSGKGQLLATCYGSAPCHVGATITSGGAVIATQTEHIGAEEEGQVYFQLTQTGETMLQHATGNQLPAQVKLTNGHDTATGSIALIAYG